MRFLRIALAVLSTFFAVRTQAGQEPSSRIDFDAGWRFVLSDSPDANGELAYSKIKEWILASGTALDLSSSPRHVRPPGEPPQVQFAQTAFDDTAWRKLDLPHDWGIEGSFVQSYPGETGKLAWWGVGWYRKHFQVTESDRGREISIDIDGAMSYAAVWVNGKFVGGWPYGYASFRLDLTPYLNFGGDNVIAVRLDNPPDSSRWYPGGGIYRHVWLAKSETIHFAHWGTFVTTARSTSSSSDISVRAIVQNDTAADQTVSVSTEIIAEDSQGHPTGAILATTAEAELRIAAKQEAQSTRTIAITNPKLWSPTSPTLYCAVTRITRAGVLVDRVETTFGIRTIAFDSDQGFFINGEHLRLQGVCDHSDLGALGTVVNRRGLERQLELLKEMGCNAIRTSHNPPAPELLELCDRMGIVVMDETFDCWRTGKRPNDYHLLFDDWSERDVRMLVRRDRNHPCVVLWSVGNEVPDQRSPDGWQIAAHLSAIVHEEDRTRPTTAACNYTESGYNGFQTALGVMGYNYKFSEYTKFKSVNPDIALVGTETASTVSTRGFYVFPVEENKSGGQADFQVSSYDLYAPPWASTPDAEFEGEDRNSYVAGEFVWTGFDYLGEPTPYNKDTSNLLNFTNSADREKAAKELAVLGHLSMPSRSSYFGIMDLCGFKKDRFYLYQAHWRPALPMVHLVPHWTWPDRVGQAVPVFVYTSGDEAELFLNDRSLGRKKLEPFKYRIRWDHVIYEPGELRVVAYRHGVKWAEDREVTAGPASVLTATADRTSLAADGSDLSYITVAIRDAKGILVPQASNLVSCEIVGPAAIAAIDNGDPTSFESFHGSQHKAFNGLAQVVIRTKAGEKGAIWVTVKAEGLTPAKIALSAN